MSRLSVSMVTFLLMLVMVNICLCQTNNSFNSVIQYNTTQKRLKENYQITNKVSALGKNIGRIFQEKNFNYWLASNGDGVFRYDGKTLLQFTIKDGLCSNFVWDIQEDVNGNLWFTTRDGICSFNGHAFTDYTNAIKTAKQEKLQYKNGGLFFGQTNDVVFYDGNSFTKFTIHPNSYHPLENDLYRPYSIYCYLIDKAGNVWFGTQNMGVCRYDGKNFTWFTDKGLKDAAIRCMFEDTNGDIWFGNNGAGLFRYNPHSLNEQEAITNFTEEKSLSNPAFLKDHEIKDTAGTLARVWAINEDENGNLWIGTIDAGLWKYDGQKLINFTVKDGLTNNSVWNIYKNKNQELLVVMGGEDIFKIEGNTFTKNVFRD